MKLLCLSNGHGEDLIALRILQQLQQLPNPPEIAALPIVGTGQSYTRHEIPLAAPVKPMPSGGFIYQDGRQLVRDLKGGLVQLTRSQLQQVRAWAKQGGAVLAVGDIVPLLFAWWSGAPYAFVGTAKSEYYLRDEQGWLPRRTWFETLESFWGSVYLPWDRWLMSHPRCKGVFPRDTLTSQILQQWSIPAFDLGNPMMDGLEPEATDWADVTAALPPESPSAKLTFLLLPGSRVPEAYENWGVIMRAVEKLAQSLSKEPLLFLGAIDSRLDFSPLQQILQKQNWRPQKQGNSFSLANSSPLETEKMPTKPLLTFARGNATLVLSSLRFNSFLDQADFALAMAGTATEQFVGLGKLAITFPGKGPQFTEAFAEAQTRLLGVSVILVERPEQVVNVVYSLLRDPDRLQLIRENGNRRMGPPGASQRIAQCLMEHLV